MDFVLISHGTGDGLGATSGTTYTLNARRSRRDRKAAHRQRKLARADSDLSPATAAARKAEKVGEAPAFFHPSRGERTSVGRTPESLWALRGFA
jgi:hypothetical protein